MVVGGTVVVVDEVVVVGGTVVVLDEVVVVGGTVVVVDEVVVVGTVVVEESAVTTNVLPGPPLSVVVQTRKVLYVPGGSPVVSYSPLKSPSASEMNGTRR